MTGFKKFAVWRKGIGAEQVHNVRLSAISDAKGTLRKVREGPTADILRRFKLCPRKGSELGADVPEAAYVGLPLLREFERRRDMADEYAGCH